MPSFLKLLSGFDGFDVRKIDDIEYTVEISCYFLTKWHEDRLVLHEDILREKFEDEIQEDEEQWYPIDLEFVSKVGFDLVSLQTLFKGGSHCETSIDSLPF